VFNVSIYLGCLTQLAKNGNTLPLLSAKLLRAVHGQKTKLGIYLFFFDLTSKLLTFSEIVFFLKALLSRKYSVGKHAVNMS
jgi:hypothetical protein